VDSTKRKNIPNKRDIQKEETRLKVLEAAKVEFLMNGWQGLSTAEVAKRASLAHGTVFFHYKTREALLTEVLNQELMNITGALDGLLAGQSDLAELLEHYLDFLEQEEIFFAILSREMAQYTAPLRRVVLGREAAVRQYFYRAYERGVEAGRYKTVDIPTVLNFLFGTIHYYLSLRDSYRDGPSVIADKRSLISRTFLNLIQRQDEDGR
jgi:AcrR family transcriptional regulator